MARPKAKLKIPDQQRPAVRALSELSPSELEGLVEALAQAEPSPTSTGLVSQVKSKVELAVEVLEPILGMLLSLYSIARRYELSAEEVAAEVTDRAVEEQLGPTPESAPNFREGLSRLLRLDRSIGVTSRLLNVMWENKNVYVSARIVSDLRSVFSSGEVPEPMAAAVVHNLRIESHTDDRHINHFFAMDNSDLRALRDAIDRAMKKESALRRVVVDTKLSFVDISIDQGV